MNQSQPRLIRGTGAKALDQQQSAFIADTNPVAARQETPVQFAVQDPGTVTAERGVGGRMIMIWAAVFLVLVAIFYSLGFAPIGILEMGDSIKSLFVPANQSAGGVAITNASQGDLSQASVITTLPVSTQARIVIPQINLDAKIQFPENRDLNILNTALVKGPVYYPGSGLFGSIGNVLIFGHSTGLSVVNNKNYEVFNRIKELKEGDVIHVYADNRDYQYVVRSLTIKNAKDTEVILSTDKALLTLVTCRIFGGNAKESRYVLEAEFMRSYALAD